MLPEPMHPALVHFPIVIALLLPLVLAGAWYSIRRGSPPVRAWSSVVAMAALLFLAAWVSVRTGQSQEDRVEEVITSEQPIHDHEESAERFLVLAGLALALSPLGLASGRWGRIGRGTMALAAVAVAIAIYPVGRSGGELVYRHGAAAAWVSAQSSAGQGEDTGTVRSAEERRRRERDER